MHLGKIAAEQPGKATMIMADSSKLLKRVLRDEYARAFIQQRAGGL
jgi:hypothetical protein